MKKITPILIFLLLTGLTVGFEGGDGSSDNPYQISTCQQLQDVENELSANYVLVSDVDCSSSSNWNSGNGFDPIGNSSAAFTGTFDGQHYAVKNLYIDRSSTDSVGLFGALNGGTIQSLEIRSSTVSGARNTGGLLGNESGGGQVINSSFQGEVRGGYRTGGLAGYIESGSVIGSYSAGFVGNSGRADAGGLVGAIYGNNIEDSYSVAEVDSGSYTGGLVGAQVGTVTNSFAAGHVRPDRDNVGGVMGAFFSGSESDSYWDLNQTGQNTSDAGIGLNTSEMIDDAEINMNLDFSSTWTSSEYYYPKLQWQETGLGTESDPYMIENCHQLQFMNQSLDSNYRLANYIDCSITEYWNEGKGFDPVGDDSMRFTGSLMGNNYRIEDIEINRPDSDFNGIFGDLGEGTDNAYVENLSVTNAIVSGDYTTGILAGRSRYGSLDSIYVTGKVEATGIFGGVVGNNAVPGEILRTKSNVTFSGSSSSGGISGWNDGLIRNSYTFGKGINGGYQKGGLVGKNGGTVETSYSAADLTDSSDTGGLIGEDDGGTVTDSYWDVPESGTNSSGGGKGLHTYEMKDKRAVEYMDGFNFTTTWAALDNDRYPELQVFTNESGFDPNVDQPPGLPESETPSNGTTEIVPDESVGVELRHPQGESMDVNFTDDSESLIGQDTGTDLGDVNTTWSGLETGNNYSWDTVIEDETSQVLDTSDWIDPWTFTTIYDPERPDNPGPANDTFSVQRNSNLGVDVYQEDGRDLVNDLYITDDLEASKDSFGLNDSVVVSGGSGTAEFDPSSSPTLNLENGTQYRWFVNSSFTADGNTFYNESEAWNFTTSERPEVQEIMPAKGESGVNPEPGLNVSIDHYSDVTVEFFDASDDSSLGTVQVQDGWANLTGYNDLDTVGQQFWYITATADTGEQWSNQDEPWNFTVSDVQNLDVDLQTTDGINRNNGSADLGSETLKAYVELDSDQEIPIKFEIFDDSGNSIQNVTSDPVSSGEDASIQLSDAGLDQDREYNWTAYYEESGSVPFGRPDQRSFTALTLDAEWERQPEDEAEEIEFYVSTASSPGFPDDYQRVGSLDPGSDLEGLTRVASSNIDEGDVNLAARVTNPLASSVPIEETETVNIQ